MQSRRFVRNSAGLTAKYLLAKRLERGDVQDPDNYAEVKGQYSKLVLWIYFYGSVRNKPIRFARASLHSFKHATN